MNAPQRPKIVVSKQDRTLTVLAGDTILLQAPVVTGKNPSDKEVEGDMATPEGEFYICYKNPDSTYHRFLGLSYPNVEDAERGLKSALITPDEATQIRQAIAKQECPPWKTKLGGEVGIHGPCPNVTWTHGCIAMSIPDIETLWSLVDIGDTVNILPSRPGGQLS
jgi:murein L,D-transpeptidase YafK